MVNEILNVFWWLLKITEWLLELQIIKQKKSKLEGCYRTNFLVSNHDQQRQRIELGQGGVDKRRPKPADLCFSAPPPSDYVSQNTSAFICLCVGLYLLLFWGKGSALPPKGRELLSHPQRTLQREFSSLLLNKWGNWDMKRVNILPKITIHSIHLLRRTSN